MKNIAVILAGGSGQRMGEEIPKQLLKIAGKRVIEHTLDVFEKHPLIDEIIIVANAGYLRDIEEISVRNCYTKLTRIITGGKERYQSSLSAIEACQEECNLLFHDAVRPLVSERVISDCIRALEEYRAVDTAVPTTDTIIRIDERNRITAIPDRNKLRNGQTPQAFRRSVIREAYRRALQDPEFKTTDDCSVVLKYLPDEPVYIVPGEIFNLKLTYKSDLFLLDKLFQLRSRDTMGTVIGKKEREQLRGKVLAVFGGSYGIGESICTLCRKSGAHVYSFSRTATGTDVSDPACVKQALEEVHVREGRIDYVINTAGILQKQPLNAMSYETVRQSVEVNLLGSVHVAKESYPYLKKSEGMLLLYTSSSYTRGRSLYSIYSATKSAIVNLMQALSEEWYADRIKINCINPERTATPMRVRNFGTEPAGTLLTAEEVASASVNTLLSNMTGEVIDVKIKK